MEPNPKEDEFNEPDTYGPMGELRFQLVYWLNGKMVQNYQAEHRMDIMVRARNTREFLRDIAHVGNDLLDVKSYGIKVFDNRDEKTLLIVRFNMDMLGEDAETVLFS